MIENEQISAELIRWKDKIAFNVSRSTETHSSESGAEPDANETAVFWEMK